ncbi:MAG TPA: hypothetical protein V6C72_00950, partial [Chroococcales cyanobacterium]
MTVMDISDKKTVNWLLLVLSLILACLIFIMLSSRQSASTPISDDNPFAVVTGESSSQAGQK